MTSSMRPVSRRADSSSAMTFRAVRSRCSRPDRATSTSTSAGLNGYTLANAASPEPASSCSSASQDSEALTAATAWATTAAASGQRGQQPLVGDVRQVRRRQGDRVEPVLPVLDGLPDLGALHAGGLVADEVRQFPLPGHERHQRHRALPTPDSTSLATLEASLETKAASEACEASHSTSSSRNSTSPS